MGNFWFVKCTGLTKWYKQVNIMNVNSEGFKAEVGSLFFVSSGKNFIITFQHVVIQVVWKNTRLLHLSLALYSDFRKWRLWRTLFSQSQVISKGPFSYWPLHAALLSDRWHRHKLIGCWNKWRALCSKTGLSDDLTSWVAGNMHRNMAWPPYWEVATPSLHAVCPKKKLISH